jgi:ABC-type branched-subunit amino acid transport system permease subunit
MRTSRALLAIAVVGAALALVPLRYGDSRSMMGVAIGGVLFAAYAVGFNIIFGNTRQLFLCVGALAGLGSYTSALLADRAGFPLVVGLVAGTAAAAVVGSLLSWVAVSRSLDTIFVGIVTLTFSLSFENLLLGRRELTGGETGLRVEAGQGTFLSDNVSGYYVFLALLLGYLLFYQWLQVSRYGWAFRALRTDEVAAELAGVDVTRYRVAGGAMGSAMLGLAGALLAHHEGFISPSSFDFGHVDIRVLVMLALGGLGTLLAPVVGGLVFVIVDELLVSAGQVRLVVYGLVTIALFLGFRRGVVPAVTSWWTKRRAA